MHFQPEIAILQSAFYCNCNKNANANASAAEENIHPSTRTEEPSQNQRVNVAAVCHAIREVIRGVHKERCNVGKHHWNFKTHAILFRKLLEKRRSDIHNSTAGKTSSSSTKSRSQDRYFDGVSRAIPNCVDMAMYLDIAAQMEWGPLCAQVLVSLDENICETLLKDIAAGCISMEYFDLIASLLTGLLHPSSTHNSPRSSATLSEKSTRSSAEGCAPTHGCIIATCKQVLTASSHLKKPTHRSEIVRALVDKLADSIKEEQSCEREECRDKSQECCQGAFPYDVYQLHLLSSSRIDDNSLKIYESVPSTGPTGKTKSFLSVVITKLVSTLHELIVARAWLSSSDGNHGDLEPDVHLTRRLVLLLRRLDTNHLNHLSALQTYHPGTLQEHCDQLVACLSTMLNAIEDSVSLAEKAADCLDIEESTNEKIRQTWLQEAVIIIDERLVGYRDSLTQMLMVSDVWEEQLWIECLERNKEILALPVSVTRLINISVAMNRRGTGPTTLQRIVHIILYCFCELPLTLQNNVRDYLWCLQGGVAVVAQYSGRQADRELTASFNRLVTLNLGQEKNAEVLTALSCLALWCPLQTIQQAIRRAASNAAVCEAVCQVFKAMPSLATYKPSPVDLWPAVYAAIDQFMISPLLSDNEEANIIQLVADLLQPYQPIIALEKCTVPLPPVLSTQAVLRGCVLAHLASSSGHDGVTLRLLRALRLLKEALHYGEITDNAISSEGTSPFAIVLCLCTILDDCCLLWDDVATPEMMTQKAVVKETVLGILEQNGGMLASWPHSGDDTDNCVSWLVHRVSSSMHWTTLLYATLKICPRQDSTKLVPKCLFDLCNLPSSDWSPVPSTANHQDISLREQLVEFLFCCRVSESLSTFVSQNVRATIGSLPSPGFLEAMTMALVQVLPQCILGEWQCIMGALKQLVAARMLRVPCSVQYVTELPVINLTDVRVPLALSQLLLGVIQLLTSPCCSNWATPHLLHHVTRCYVSTMQVITAEISTGTPSGRFFVIGQLFCHTCDVIHSLSTGELKDQVFVLSLEYLSQMAEMTTIEEMGLDWANQRAVFERLANRRLAGEHRRTLQQKLCCFVD